MNRQKVEASFIAGIGYDFDRHILEVEFSKGGVWQYSGFPEDLWNEFDAAERKGHFFATRIRAAYTPMGQRVS